MHLYRVYQHFDSPELDLIDSSLKRTSVPLEGLICSTQVHASTSDILWRVESAAYLVRPSGDLGSAFLSAIVGALPTSLRQADWTGEWRPQYRSRGSIRARRGGPGHVRQYGDQGLGVSGAPGGDKDEACATDAAV